MATPKKKATKKKPRVEGKLDKKKKSANSYAIKPDRYSITKATGRPLYYETAELLAAEIDSYFDYIKGEYSDEVTEYVDVKTGKKRRVKTKVCIREPEVASITGLTLYLGFSDMNALRDYAKKGPKFASVIKMGQLRIANRHERNLSGTATPTGSIFWLKAVMAWKDGSLFGEDGETTVIGFKYVIPNKPKNDEEQT
jgi:hypothetical protein